MSVLSEIPGLTAVRVAPCPRRTAAVVPVAPRTAASSAPPVAAALTAVAAAQASAARWPRRLGLAMTVAGVAMVPWLVVLALTLPARAAAGNWTTVWVGLDSVEALGLAFTGVLLRHRDARASLTAAGTAVLLLVDAWFDVLTSAPGGDRLVAVLMAACAEVPLAVLCAALAIRLFPRQALAAASAALRAAPAVRGSSEH
ncbi:MAG: hypothetical protein ACRDVE_05825 [Actinocrinis sp.]